MNNNETKKVLSLIEELKKGISDQEIENVEDEKDDIIWSKVDESVKDLWYETLGDAKKGLYH